MKFGNNKIVPSLFAAAGVLSLVPAVKELVKGEPVRVVFLVMAFVFLALAFMFLAVARKSDGGSGSSSA